MSITALNAPCPCGSGKKYKKCCLSVRNESNSGQGVNKYQVHLQILICLFLIVTTLVVY